MTARAKLLGPHDTQSEISAFATSPEAEMLMHEVQRLVSGFAQSRGYAPSAAEHLRQVLLVEVSQWIRQSP